MLRETINVEDTSELRIITKRITNLIELATKGTGILKIEVSKLGMEAHILEEIAAFSVDGMLYIDTKSKKWVSHVNKNSSVLPKITWENFKSVVSAVLTGVGVSKDRQEKRLFVCHSCDQFRWDIKKNSASCGICGCKLGNKSNKLLDLTVYEETINYGCKHPNGSKWKENNC